MRAQKAGDIYWKRWRSTYPARKIGVMKKENTDKKFRASAIDYTAIVSVDTSNPAALYWVVSP